MQILQVKPVGFPTFPLFPLTPARDVSVLWPLFMGLNWTLMQWYPRVTFTRSVCQALGPAGRSLHVAFLLYFPEL